MYATLSFFVFRGQNDINNSKNSYFLLNCGSRRTFSQYKLGGIGK